MISWILLLVLFFFLIFNFRLITLYYWSVIITEHQEFVELIDKLQPQLSSIITQSVVIKRFGLVSNSYF